MQALPGTAVVLGVSSGIGEALARQLAAAGWRLGLVARRLERLEALTRELHSAALVRRIDLGDAEAAAALLEAFFDDLGGVDLVIISSGTGQLNPDVDWALDRDTLAVNVVGFTAAAQVAIRHFLRRGRGHLLGTISAGGLRGNAADAAYCASKAYQSTYLDGLRDAVAQRRLPITITEAQPGFVDTAMMKAERTFWVASAEAAARQIIAAIRRRSKHVYVTRRWAIIALTMKWLPRRVELRGRPRRRHYPLTRSAILPPGFPDLQLWVNRILCATSPARLLCLEQRTSSPLRCRASPSWLAASPENRTRSVSAGASGLCHELILWQATTRGRVCRPAFSASPIGDVRRGVSRNWLNCPGAGYASTSRPLRRKSTTAAASIQASTDTPAQKPTTCCENPRK
jgi:short-subunit dehydrogenase